MPLRAFIDSDEGKLTPAEKHKVVLMPLRAFIDSDEWHAFCGKLGLRMS